MGVPGRTGMLGGSDPVGALTECPVVRVAPVLRVPDGATADLVRGGNEASPCGTPAACGAPVACRTPVAAPPAACRAPPGRAPACAAALGALVPSAATPAAVTPAAPSAVAAPSPPATGPCEAGADVVGSRAREARSTAAPRAPGSRRPRSARIRARRVNRRLSSLTRRTRPTARYTTVMTVATTAICTRASRARVPVMEPSAGPSSRRTPVPAAAAPSAATPRRR